MTQQMSDEWGDGGTQTEEDLNALGVSVKVAGEEDDLDESEDLEKDEDTVVAPSIEDEEEPLDGLARLEMLEKTLEVDPIDLGEEE
ncbi:hypothetical protein KJ781_01095 [Patescibacteria group bacterium]|nr:hypothetical protein [Patescibacteria group bacterium]MBU1448747.1 hypothetical protein [Patescibacteria group bacterium]MBU2613582.1 hypothetical protein [Patescibacteria group bacterium]